MARTKKPCFHFRDHGCCKNGNACNFSHDTATTGGSTKSFRSDNKCIAFKKGSCSRGADCRFSHEDCSNTAVSDLEQWQNILHHPHPAGLFGKAFRLVQVDHANRQAVIVGLASERGVTKIRSLLSQDFTIMNDHSLNIVFRTDVIPLFQTITDQRVLDSGLLERHLDEIFPIVFGPGGARAEALIVAAIRVLTSLLGSDCAEFAINLKATLAVLLQVLSFNTAAKTMPCFQDQASLLGSLVKPQSESESSEHFAQAAVYHDRICRCLGLGQAIPAMKEGTRNTKDSSKAVFKLQRAGPGRLSNGQPRHDNDFDAIDKISILPTFEEIMSLHPEYLPLRDPATWHKSGLEGLIDRHFRLLREDTVGQLRDAARVELQALQQGLPGITNNTTARKDTIRTFTYRNIRVEQPTFDIHKGLEFVISFDQPESLQSMSVKERQNWWDNSKRLEGDALVCILNSGRAIVFCTVCLPPVPGKSNSRKDNEEAKPSPHEGFTLWRDPNIAYVVLRPVSMDEQSISHLLGTFSHSIYYGGRSLVEFPGALLPSFLPTLKAMQSLSKNLDLPFSEFLAPPSEPLDVDDQKVHVQPPVYAQKRGGFKLNLKSVCKTEQDMFVDPNNLKKSDLQALQEISTLDDSQASALLQSLSRRLAMIQGPPGTGKSYTGISLIKVLLANKDVGQLGPILCVCYTNHALDQLLEHLLDKGVEQIIRIGSRSKSERLTDVNLRKVVKNMQSTKTESKERWEVKKKMTDQAKGINVRLASLANAETPASIRRYLDDTHRLHSAELFGSVDEEGFIEVRHNKDHQALKNWLFSGRTGSHAPNRPIDVLQRQSIWTMSESERCALYIYWISRIREPDLQAILTIVKTYNKHKIDADRVRNELDLRALNEANVIGITTTGLARNLDLLRRLHTKVLLVEEAGEVMESHLITALLPSIEHAILIGDHLQLRPHVQNYKLSMESPEGQQYAMDASLFERLVEPLGQGDAQLPFSRLDTQRRMHPSIAELVRRPLYPSLVDAPPSYPEVAGMKKRLYWFDHSHFEANVEQAAGVATSQTNDFEVDMTIALVSHLVKQGEYHANEIAVLTPYLGQLRKLRSRMMNTFEVVLGERDVKDLAREDGDTPTDAVVAPARRATLFQALRIATVDNFQGEEAKVVVISLVRSNSQQKCGFLKTSNRINVLLSRAQHGMYIIGNAATSQHVPMWEHVISILRENQNIGPALEIQCPRHPDTAVGVHGPEDFLLHAPDGGCTLPCVQRLKCGHACPGKCHSELLHDAVHCLVPCPRSLDGCIHACPGTCGDPCVLNCNQMVNAHVEMPCGHEVDELPCYLYQNQDMIICNESVTKKVPGCGHMLEVSCFADVSRENFDCTQICGATLACGHLCEMPCHECNKKEDAEIIAVKHGKCTKECGRPFTGCEHACTEPCHQDRPCELCRLSCSVKCAHSACQKTCCEPCVPCAEDQCASGCPHSSCSMPCAAPCDWIPCSLRCGERLACGHQCPSICGVQCPDISFCQICGSNGIKTRVVDLILLETYEQVDLDKSPCIFPDCGHFYIMESLDGHVDMSEHYELDGNGLPVALKAPNDTLDFKKDHFVCPECRRSLRDISRYGRPVRQALLIESTLKFITWSNAEYVPLAELFFKQQQQLQDTAEKTKASLENLSISGQASEQMMSVRRLSGASRYRAITDLRYKIKNFVKKVSESEQPFKRVQDLVKSARNRQRTAADFKVDPSFLQTRSFIMATALRIRCDLAILSDVLLTRQSRAGQTETFVDLKINREECDELGRAAEKKENVLQQVEALLFWARFAALELPWASVGRNIDSDDYEEEEDEEEKENEKHQQLRNRARNRLSSARQLCDKYPSQTRAVSSSELDDVEKMLRESTFYTPVTPKEMREVVAAMATEFTGTGHWYRCENNHPFTVGECGGPMEETRCPQCDAPIGGRHHQAAAGVTHARDLETEFGDMHL